MVIKIDVILIYFELAGIWKNRSSNFRAFTVYRNSWYLNIRPHLKIEMSGVYKFIQSDNGRRKIWSLIIHSA